MYLKLILFAHMSQKQKWFVWFFYPLTYQIHKQFITIVILAVYKLTSG